MAAPAAADQRAVMAAASVAIEGLLTGPGVAATVVGDYPVAMYLAVPGGVVAVVAAEAIRLPNAVVVAPADVDAAHDHVSRSGELVVGAGGVRLGGLTIAVRRWWDPVPRLSGVDRASLAAALAEIDLALPPWPVPDDPAGARLVAGRELLVDTLAGTADAERATDALVGLGAGLTPAGDDVLAGAIAASVLFGRAMGATLVVDAAVRLAQAASRRASRTTPLAADLTRHAVAGAVAEPVADLCRAFAEGRPPLSALRHLLAAGHTSGRDLTEGIVIAARVLTQLS